MCCSRILQEKHVGPIVREDRDRHEIFDQTKGIEKEVVQTDVVHVPEEIHVVLVVHRAKDGDDARGEIDLGRQVEQCDRHDDTYGEFAFFDSNDEQDLHEDSKDFLDHYRDITRCLERMDGLDPPAKTSMGGTFLMNR